MKPLHPVLFINRSAKELVQWHRLFQMRQHGAEPDQFAGAPLPDGRALELQRQQARRQVPEPAPIEAGSDIGLVERPEV